jgi:dipeptidyl aminopeptidase/acylaminoacyl peptidase
MDASRLCRAGVMLTSLCLSQLAAVDGSGGDDGRRAWTPESCFRIKGVGQVQPSPDGKEVIYTITETVVEAKGASARTCVFLANADGTGARRLTPGTSSPSQPQWSTDGAWIAYLDQNNLCRVRRDGTGRETLIQGRVVSLFKWAPDGSAVAFIEAIPAAKTAPGVGLIVDEDIFQWRPQYYRLCLVSTAKDVQGAYAVRKLTSDDFYVYAMSFDWSPNSKDIAFIGAKTKYGQNAIASDLWLVHIATGELRPLANPGAAVRNPHFSPDGQLVACTVSDAPPTWTCAHRVQLVPAKGGTPNLLAPTFNEAPALVGWSADGNKVYYVEAERTSVRLFALPLEGKPVPLSKADRVVGGKDGMYGGGVFLNATRTMVGFTMQTLRQPDEAFVSKLDAFTPVQITRVNEALDKLPLAQTELIRWKSADGLPIEGLLTYPLGYTSGKRYPLLLVIHGGPHGVYSQTFLANPSTEPAAIFAARGFAVLRSNPRGSTGYGAKFRHANYKDLGGGDYEDLMAGVDNVVGQGVADDKRLGVMGYSYGGFLTAWTITRTKRFKAASVGAGITNLVSEAGTTAVTSFLPSYFGDHLWDNLDLLQKRSPICHVKSVTTPTLIYHGDKDVIAPISQSYELYNALKRQGCVTQMVVYPGATHSLGSFRNLDAMKRNLAWMDKYIK